MFASLDGARTVGATDLALLAASPQLPSALVPAALPGPATLPDGPNRDNPPGMGGPPRTLPRQGYGSAPMWMLKSPVFARVSQRFWRCARPRLSSWRIPGEPYIAARSADRTRTSVVSGA